MLEAALTVRIVNAEQTYLQNTLQSVEESSSGGQASLPLILPDLSADCAENVVSRPQVCSPCTVRQCALLEQV